MVGEANVSYLLTSEVEDGVCTDNFEIYVNGEGPLYQYQGVNAGTANVTVVVHQVMVPVEYIPQPRVTITFRNTSTDDCGGAAVYNVALVSNQPPDPPTDLVQLLPDGTNISVGGAVDQPTVVFKGTVADPDGDRVKLQVELRRLDELGGEFDETQGGLKESDLVATASEATCEAHGLIPSDYHWRTRAMDEHGEVSEWVDFGNNLLSAPDFTVVSEGDDNPRIVSIEPESGAPAIEARIIGKNFDNIFPIQQVTFGGRSAMIVDWSDTQIVFKVPCLPGEERTVDVRAGPFPNSNSVKFTYNEPLIDWINPPSGLGGEEVTISGKDFGYTGCASYVKFGCSIAYALSWTDTEIVAEAPLDYGTGEIAKEVLKWILKLVAGGVDVPKEIADVISDLIMRCDIEVPPAGGRIEVDVRVYTDVGASNPAAFTYRVSRILEANLYSPGELRVYDSSGRVTGLVNGEMKEEIPHSLYDGSSVIVVAPHDSYRYEVVGTDDDEGTYGLGLNSVEEGEATTFVATDIPTSADATHQYTVDWDALSQGQEGVTVQVDSDGDGTFEQDFTADSDLTQDEFLAGDTTPPATVTDLVTANPTTDSMTLNWTAPGDDGNTGIASEVPNRSGRSNFASAGTHSTAYKVYFPIIMKNHPRGHDSDVGTASEYDIRYSTSPITDANWDAATQCAGETTPQSAGSRETFTCKDLTPGTTYYFALKTADEVPNWSSLSNVASGTTLRPPDTTAPATVTNLRTSNPTVDSMTLNWTASGDDGNTGTASEYDIRHSTSPITAANWNAAA